jgi:hypothetical protein
MMDIGMLAPKAMFIEILAAIHRKESCLQKEIKKTIDKI